MPAKNLLLTLSVMLLFMSCKKELKTFTQLDPDDTGIRFSNRIAENDTMNILAYEYVYNGGGVALGDFNNDSLPDVYFTGNTVHNKLYLNKGDFKFEDVTDKAGVAGKDRWAMGVALVDINNDNLLDIYVCSSVKKVASERENLLYVNQGMDENKVPVFKEMGKEYGIADTTHTTNAAFFDYDNDGDLDLFLVVNEMDDITFPNKYHKKIVDGSSKRTDRLYRNDWDPKLNHPVFTNVSKEAGILIEGYGLGVNVTDVNQDGWKDIYVTNDYLTNDLMYVNNGDGTFTDKAPDYFKHTSHSAMGNDIADINNDGLVDVIAVDMMPATNRRKKMMTPANSYVTYQNNELFGYQYQVARNTLQLNLGKANPKSKDPVFSEIGLLSGIAETDWSWTPMITDFDNDGLRDIIITNGFPKDITDLDFVAYRAEVSSIMEPKMMLDFIPSVKIKNFAFRNKGNLIFEDVTDQWGIEATNFSNGAAYADLDNDGDLDYIINNINDSAAVFRNNCVQIKPNESNYLRIGFKGERYNRNGIGAIVEITYADGKKQISENSPYRGYLSTVEPFIHFGLGTVTKVDRLKVTWPGGKSQIFNNVNANQLLVLSEKNAIDNPETKEGGQTPNPLFTDITAILNVPYKHEETDIIDFNLQKLMPHKLSQYGPSLAAGDVNGDGLDDIFVGGAYMHKGRFLIQQTDGRFKVSDLLPGAEGLEKNTEDMGVLLFDADLDKDLDLFIVSGSYEIKSGEGLRCILYLNDGKGKFHLDPIALPQFLVNGSCVKAADYDKDGDLDLFIGGRVESGAYPKPVSSFVLRNDTKNNVVRFSDATTAIAPELVNIGLVCDALWTDFDNDGWQDLVVAGEWMPVTFFKNEKGKLKKIISGLENQKGWWGSLVAGDFDNDGDMDYVAGNLGLNSLSRASEKQPVSMYAKDFNNDGYFDAIPTVFYKASDETYKEFPYNTRDDMGKQIIQVRQRFQEYGKFAESALTDILKPEELKDALHLSATYMPSSYFENQGNGKFKITSLPLQAQFAPIFGMIAADIDQDGNLDLMLSGNDYGSEVSVGRYDAFYGLILKGNGKGSFVPLTLSESGYVTTGNAKGLVKLGSVGTSWITVTSQNRDSLRFHKSTQQMRRFPLLPTETSVVLKLRNGKSRKEELTFGSSFLSQSSHTLFLPKNVTEAIIMRFDGSKRSVK